MKRVQPLVKIATFFSWPSGLEIVGRCNFHWDTGQVLDSNVIRTWNFYAVTSLFNILSVLWLFCLLEKRFCISELTVVFFYFRFLCFRWWWPLMNSLDTAFTPCGFRSFSERKWRFSTWKRSCGIRLITKLS